MPGNRKKCPPLVTPAITQPLNNVEADSVNKANATSGKIV